jgi:alkanesulfonate monooxygenase SsuD/methylene tetrahydromethanopterin reductase-like flavin-dependent oxidoreductase (luciferase family)
VNNYFKEFSAGITFIKNKAKEFNRDPNKILMAWGGSGIRNIITKDENSAIKIAESILGSKHIHSSPWIIGSPTRCIKKIESYIKAGATHIVLGLYDFPSIQSLKLFSEAILSTFK